MGLIALVKDAIIKKRKGGGATLYSHKGKVLGQHTSVEGAKKQEAAIWANKTAEDHAPGLPSRERFGDLKDLPRGVLLKYVLQRHLSSGRAGAHTDVRIHGAPNDMTYSWATRKNWPGPGEKRMLFQQGLHRAPYSDFEGELKGGYGAGTVSKAEEGQLAVTHADSNKVNFAILSKHQPETYALIRQSGPPAEGTPRTKKTQGGSWLLVNTTPADAARMLSGKPEEVGLQKLKFTTIPEKDVEQIFDSKHWVQPKVDGASLLVHVLGDKINMLSYRTQKNTGAPILHSHRFFGPAGAKPSNLPPELEGSILRGEVFGTRQGKSIPPQELGGLLNSSPAKSIADQHSRRIQLKTMLFDVVRRGKTPVSPVGAEERMKLLQEISAYLPKKKFTLPASTNNPDEAKQMWEDISSGKNPLTSEGVVAWPQEAGSRPVKVKTYPESDVHIRNVFPGEKGLAGIGAGGFDYADSPEGKVLGRVGTGFSEETRRDMLEHPEEWVGRIARIKSQQQFPSGAHRAPVFISRHESA